MPQTAAAATHNPALYSTMIRGAKTTYFVDAKEARTGQKYLAITSTTRTNGEPAKRVTVRIFQDSFDSFRQAILEAMEAANK